ncbi:MAG: hypothetical protein MSIBF_06565 [Candidatus Altiarchaeales archaeon IMC4]|nr:MAG: hypothetical protein MSIBF_06565 [Candidatus Altiarchaeales archaeon IMC4]
MPNFKFSVPYNNNQGLLNRISDVRGSDGNGVQEIYLSGPPEYLASGRIMPRLDIEGFTSILGKIHDMGLRANLILNSTCEGLDWYHPKNVSSVIRYVKKMHTEHGLEAVTVANPLYLQRIRKELPKIEINASVLADIDSVQRAVFFKKLGADVIIPDRDINRDLELLKEVKEAVDCELKLMVNEGCLFKCPYRKFHFNMVSHWSKEGKTPKDQFFFNCHHISRIDPSQILKSCWIRPEDLKKYSKITDYFKISGRTRDTEWIINAAKAYLNEGFNGNLLEIMDSNLNEVRVRYNAFVDNKSLDGFLKKVASCDKNCFRCHYCDELATKIINFA